MLLRWKIAQWFELRWWQNYLRGKDKETYLNWKKTYWQNLLSTIAVQVKPTDTVCDLGCGPAGIFIALPKHTITAVDPLLNAYQKQTSFFKPTDYSNITFITTTIEEFNTAIKFDIVFCMNAINHVLNIENGFKKIADLKKENGTVVVSIDAHNFSFLKFIFRAIPGDILHPHQYDLNEYELFLNKQNLRLVKTQLVKREFIFNHYVLVAV